MELPRPSPDRHRRLQQPQAAELRPRRGARHRGCGGSGRHYRQHGVHRRRIRRPVENHQRGECRAHLRQQQAFAPRMSAGLLLPMARRRSRLAPSRSSPATAVSSWSEAARPTTPPILITASASCAPPTPAPPGALISSATCPTSNPACPSSGTVSFHGLGFHAYRLQHRYSWPRRSHRGGGQRRHHRRRRDRRQQRARNLLFDRRGHHVDACKPMSGRHHVSRSRLRQCRHLQFAATQVLRQHPLPRLLFLQRWRHLDAPGEPTRQHHADQLSIE